MTINTNKLINLRKACAQTLNKDEIDVNFCLNHFQALSF